VAAPGAQRGVARLLNTAGGRVLCLAGAVDGAVVDAFLSRYGREPARIDGVDARSVTDLSPPALALVRDHLDAARSAGLPVTLRLSAPAERLLTTRRHGPSSRRTGCDLLVPGAVAESRPGGQGGSAP
jgi:hypothetical protein